MRSTPAICFGLRAHGVSLRVRTDRESLASAIAARASALQGVPDERRRAALEYRVSDDASHFDLACNGDVVCRTRDVDALVDAFEDHARIEIGFRAPEHLFVHAGVVGWRGRAIVLPGRSRAGKTTLVEAMVRGGAEYYSDEFAILDVHGRVHPYAVPLSIRASAGTARIRTGVESIGGRVGEAPLPIGRVVITQYTAGARWRPRTVSPALAMLALMDNTVAARQPPQRTMPILRQAVEGAIAIRGRRGEADRTARALLAQTP